RAGRAHRPAGRLQLDRGIHRTRTRKRTGALRRIGLEARRHQETQRSWLPGVTEIDLGMPALASLVPISILTGIGTLLVFRSASDQAAVRRAKSLVTAHLLEFRLFM